METYIKDNLIDITYKSELTPHLKLPLNQRFWGVGLIRALNLLTFCVRKLSAH
jgi:hypothetical protein